MASLILYLMDVQTGFKQKMEASLRYLLQYSFFINGLVVNCMVFMCGKEPREQGTSYLGLVCPLPCIIHLYVVISSSAIGPRA